MILIIDENNSFKHSKFTKLVFRDIGKSVKIKKLELTESHKRISLTNKEKQFSKKEDRYKAIYILKVAIEAILLRLEQYLHFVYIESMLNLM